MQRHHSVPRPFLVGLAWCVAIVVRAEDPPAIPLPFRDLHVVAVTSEQAGSEAAKAIDGDGETYWHSRHGNDASLPQALTVGWDAPREVCGITCLSRPDEGNGTIDGFEVQVSRDGTAWDTAVAAGRLKGSAGEPAVVRFAPRADVRFLRLVALSARNRKPQWASLAELQVLRVSHAPPTADFTVPGRLARTGTIVRFRDTSTGAPASRVWTFPGGRPATSTAAEPEVVYERPGRYGVRLESANANGRHAIERQDAIEVLPAATNLAVWLDGRDNELLLGMGIIQPPWTVELWAKGDGDPWRRSEVLVGAGQYTDIVGVDPVPLELVHGRPASRAADITAEQPLGAGWHHLAVACDGRQTVLMVDGREAGRADKASAIIPGALGNHVDPMRVFGGALDELRIWRAALPVAMVDAWRHRPVAPDHPQRQALAGWWSFDDFDGELARNLVGGGPLPFHLRSGRLAFRGDRPLAHPIVNDLASWRADGPAVLSDATVVRSEWPALVGQEDVPLARLRLAVAGGASLGRPTAVTIDLGGCTRVEDLQRLHLSQVLPRGTPPRRLAAVEVAGRTTLRLDLAAEDSVELTPGVHALQLGAALSPQAAAGHLVRATIRSVTIAGREYQPQQDDGSRAIELHPSSAADGSTLRVLDWNIWHGGRHLGAEGPRRILELLRASRADLITMQEAYGAQEMLARELGFHLHTPGPNANLAILSRFPLRVLPTTHGGFQSILVEVTLPGGRQLLLADWWARYASYGDGSYLNPGEDTATWVRDDERLSTADVRSILEKDLLPNWQDRTRPVIIGGDFNSTTHLDWTAAAARFHGGYGPVPFPTSRLLQDHGFGDSFRIRHPDEVARPDGSFAVVYGHLQHCRIDFIYQHGLDVLHSDVIRTSPEPDSAWASDHAAVLTVFRVP